MGPWLKNAYDRFKFENVLDILDAHARVLVDDGYGKMKNN